MTLNTERLSKRLWLVNGVLLLAALVVVLLLIGYVAVGERMFAVEPAAVRAEPVVQAGRPARAVRFGEPEQIRGTEMRLVAVRHGHGDVHQRGAGIGSSSSYGGHWRDGPLVNVLFLDPKSGEGRLLLDRAAFIEAIDKPRQDEDPLRRLIVYRIVFADSDGDGELSEKDGAELWVSDLEGRGFRRASPEGFFARGHTFLEGGRQLLILAVERPTPGQRNVGEEQMPQRTFTYDAASQTTRPLVALDSLALAAGRLVGGR